VSGDVSEREKRKNKTSTLQTMQKNKEQKTMLQTT
jgi:hypothetical protein